jgi:radical SAM protein with 4Fe4S-binding SPASM domain
MKQGFILRKEWFGGLLISMPSCRMAFLDANGFLQTAEALRKEPPDGIARVVDITTRGYPLRRDSLASPGVAYIEITRRCDMECKHCYANARPDPDAHELPFKELERLLHDLASSGAYSIRLTGGEPTLRPDFFDLLDVIAEEGMKPSLNTHGRYSEKTLRQILDRGVEDIRVSLDGTEEVNDALRGRGSYRKVLATLRRLAESNKSIRHSTDPTINVVLMKTNQLCIRPLIELAAGLGFKISFGLLRPTGRARGDEMLSPDDVARAALEVEQLRWAMGLTKDRVRINFDVFCPSGAEGVRKPFPFDNTKCPIVTIGVGISAEGRIVPCNYLVCVPGNRWLGEDVRGKDILDLWHNSMILNEARMLKRAVCHGCPYYATKCNGGCPAVAYVFAGDLDGSDPYCIRNVEVSGGDFLSKEVRPCSS